MPQRLSKRKMERRNVSVIAFTNEDGGLLQLLFRPSLGWLLAHIAAFLGSAETKQVTAPFVARLLKAELDEVTKIQKARLDSSVL